MGKVDGNNPHIKFGSRKVEVGKSNGVKRESIAGDNAKDSMKSIFNKYDTNKDGYLDNTELAKLYSDLNSAAGNGRLSKLEAKALAKRLGIKDVKREDFKQFTEALAAENDGVSALWDGNKYTVVDGNKTTVKQYRDDAHELLQQEIVTSGNSTTTTNYNEAGKITTKVTDVSNGEMVTSRQVDTYADDGETVVKTEKYGPGGEKLIQEIKKVGDNIVTTDFNDAGKPTKRTVKDPQGNETVTTIEYAADGSYTETTNGEVKHFNADGTAKVVEPETVVPESKQHKVQSGEYWYKIVQDEYGVTDHNTIMEIVHQLKDLAGPQYGKEVNYGSSSMPRELTLPTTIELKNGQKITLTNPPEGVAAAATPDAATEVAEVPGAERTEDPNSESSEDQNAGATQKQATPGNIAALKTHLESFGIQGAVVEQLEDGQVKVTVNGQEYTGTVEQVKAAIAEKNAAPVPPVAPEEKSSDGGKTKPQTFAEVDASVTRHLLEQLPGISNPKVSKGVDNNTGETVFCLEISGNKFTGQTAEEINGKLDQFLSQFRSTESGAKFKIKDNGEISCLNAATLLRANQDETDDKYITQMGKDNKSQISNTIKHNTYLELSKLPEAELSDAEKTYMQNFRQELNEKGYTVLSDGHIVDTKLHNMNEKQQIQIVPKDDGKNEIVVTKRGADGKIQTIRLKEEDFCNTPEKAEGLRAALAELYEVTEEPLQEIVTVGTKDILAATAGAEEEEAEEVVTVAHRDTEHTSERSESEIKMIDYFNSFEGAQVKVIDNGKIKVTYKGETEIFNVANEELDRFAIWAEGIDTKLTPEERAAVVNGTYQGDHVTVDGVTHYRYSDCDPSAVVTVDGKQLHKDAAEKFKKMQAAAAADGVELVLVSGLRTTKDQVRVFKKKFNDPNNPTEAEMNARVKYSAPSGFSEHHTGLALDICSTEESFANTKEYQWLQVHAHEYGFELSFPQDNDQGLGYEPWHWRFVGTDEAREQFGDARSSDSRFAAEYFVGG